MTKPPAFVEAELADEVAAFLLCHPSFLAENPDLYRFLEPPERVHGDGLTDHMAAMLQRERVRAAELAHRSETVLAASRAALALSARVQDAVLALIAADDPLAWIDAELPALLGLDSAALCCERPLPGARVLPRGAVARLLAARDIVFRDSPFDAGTLHAEAALLARRDALVRAPCASDRVGPALLALGSRDAHALQPEHSSGLIFLGKALGAALQREAA